MNTMSRQSEAYFSALAEELEIPERLYEQAITSYESYGKWLHREDSKVKDYKPDVYVQGSFRLGTAIRPPSDKDEYDIDSVCLLGELSKKNLTQKALKTLIEVETKAYRKSKGIKKEIKEGRRCWTIEYADGAQFHMDILPALHNGDDQRLLLERLGKDVSWVDTAIAITDNESRNYDEITSDWPRSNPKGYSSWFIQQMGEIYINRRNEVFKEHFKHDINASIEDIPTYRVRTPLQQAIMILKRHRDEMYVDDTNNLRPISIILTTLSSHAYEGEKNIGEALLAILDRMDRYIDHDGTKYIVKNPTDGTENFADKWEEYPERAESFFVWLDRVRADFQSVISQNNIIEIAKMLEPRFGKSLSERVIGRLGGAAAMGGGSLLQPATSATNKSDAEFSFPDTKRSPSKPRDFA